MSILSNDFANSGSNPRETRSRVDELASLGDLVSLPNSHFSELMLTKPQEMREQSETRCLLSGNSLRIANYYTDSGCVVVGDSYKNFPTHDSVHTGFGLWRRSVGTEMSTEDQRLLENSKVDGYRDGNNYIVRIEDHEKLIIEYIRAKGDERIRARERIDSILDRYERAIAIATKAAHLRGGKVILEAEESQSGESYRLMVAKILGRLHQASAQDSMLVDKFVRKSVQTIDAGECLYSKTTHTRYFLPDQYASLADKVDNRDEFLKGIRQLDELLHSKNRWGSRQGQLLIVDPESQIVVETESALAPWNARIRRLRLKAESIRETWSAHTEELKSELLDIANAHTINTHPIFQRMDMENSEFVSKIAEMLRSGKTELALGKGISTPLMAVENGYFSRSSKREFVHTGAESIHEKITSWVLANFPEARDADWLVICEPQIPLTFDHHPSQTVKDFGDLPQKSYVVMFGKIGEEERRVVIRENVWAPHRWAERSTETVKELLESYSPVELSEWAQHFRIFQYHLSHELVHATGLSQVAVAEKFKTITIGDGDQPDNFEYRDFVNGGRADLQKTDQWSYEKFQALMGCLGQLFAVCFVEQVPDISLSDIVITSSAIDGSPEKITLLSATETFCHSLGIKSLDTYTKKIPTLYANHLVRWVEAYCSGGMGAQLTTEQKNERREELIGICLKAMKRGLINISRSATNDFLKEVKSVESFYADYQNQHKPPPAPLDMRYSLKLSEQLANLRGLRTDDVISEIENRALEESNTLEQLIQIANSRPERMPTPAQIDEFLTASCSLIGNHFSDSRRFPIIVQVLKDFAANISFYSLQEMTWIFTLIDVGVRLSELGGEERRQALQRAAATSKSFEEFYTHAQDPRISLNLPRRTLRMFFESIEGLVNVLRHLDGNDPKKAQIRKDLKLVYLRFAEQLLNRMDVSGNN